LPTRAELFTALRRCHTEKAAAQIEEFRARERYGWMKWLPSFGIGYNLRGNPVPTVSFSLAQVYNNLNQKEMTVAKTRSLLRGSDLAFKTDSIDLDILLRKVDILREALQYDEAVAQVDADIWALKQQQYAAKEIPSEAFLAEKRAFIQRAAALAEKRKELALLELEVLRVGKW
jgi:hypothetical protein